MQWVSISLLLCCGLVQANTNGTVFLERGHRGIVPCPPVKSGQIAPDDVVAMYWYYGSISRTSLLISYFRGRVAPQNRIPEGVYDIDDEFNLIIENVNASTEGTYYFQAKPHLKVAEEGPVNVSDKVSPSQPHPIVIGCDQDFYDADRCETRLHYSSAHNLTCIMDQVKPAVELRWIRMFGGGLTKLNAYTIVRPLVLPTYSSTSLRNNTFLTSASIRVNSVDDNAEYVCEAVGVAVGRGTHMIVRTKTPPTMPPYEFNPGTTVVLKEEPASTSDAAVITLSVLLSIAVIVIFALCICNRRLKKELSYYEPVETDPPETDPQETEP